jgi:hypothetical protein
MVIATTTLLAVRTVVVTCHGDAEVPEPVTADCDTLVQAAAPVMYVPVTAVPTAMSGPSPEVM